MKSDNVKKGIERAPHRSLFKSMGYTEKELSQPLVGIANPVNDIRVIVGQRKEEQSFNFLSLMLVRQQSGQR